MKTLIEKELNNTIRLLEAEIPANPESESNIKLSSQLERELRKYFNMLLVSIPEEAIIVLYNKYVEQA